MKMIDLAVKGWGPKGGKYYPTVAVQNEECCELEPGTEVMLMGRVKSVTETDDEKNQATVEITKLCPPECDLHSTFDKMIAKNAKKAESEEDYD